LSCSAIYKFPSSSSPPRPLLGAFLLIRFPFLRAPVLQCGCLPYFFFYPPWGVVRPIAVFSFSTRARSPALPLIISGPLPLSFSGRCVLWSLFSPAYDRKLLCLFFPCQVKAPLERSPLFPRASQTQSFSLPPIFPLLRRAARLVTPHFLLLPRFIFPLVVLFFPPSIFFSFLPTSISVSRTQLQRKPRCVGRCLWPNSALSHSRLLSDFALFVTTLGCFVTVFFEFVLPFSLHTIFPFFLSPLPTHVDFFFLSFPSLSSFSLFPLVSHCRLSLVVPHFCCLAHSYPQLV